ncbi:hypothetical protein J3E69DRAFT_332024 [Trichoderma sp. SZMC 28015]
MAAHCSHGVAEERCIDQRVLPGLFVRAASAGAAGAAAAGARFSTAATAHDVGIVWYVVERKVDWLFV